MHSETVYVANFTERNIQYTYVNWKLEGKGRNTLRYPTV